MARLRALTLLVGVLSASAFAPFGWPARARTAAAAAAANGDYLASFQDVQRTLESALPSLKKAVPALSRTTDELFAQVADITAKIANAEQQPAAVKTLGDYRSSMSSSRRRRITRPTCRCA